jgi:5'-3' exonuclease
MKRKFMKEADVLEKFLIPPHQVRDYLAIVWDTSDNIPGISGFWPKKAVDLLHKYWTLENIYAHAHELSETMRVILERERENAFLSQKLASITTTLPPITIPVWPFASWLQNDTYRKLLEDFEFRSLIGGGQKVEAKTERNIDVTLIDTMTKLESTLECICHLGEKIFLSVENGGKIFFGHRGTIYSLDERWVDVNLFIDRIFASDVEIVWYDLKADIKKLLSHKQKLLQNTSEEQKRLF